MNFLDVWREANEAWFRILDVAADMMEFIMDVHRLEKMFGGDR